jgi:hypothetical protein
MKEMRIETCPAHSPPKDGKPGKSRMRVIF